MPRNGLGVMSWPPNTNGVPNTTVSSTRYNAFLADLLADLNAVRPITSGGTGGTSAVSGNDGLNTSGADMASAATLNLANATGVVITVTGTTGITALGTVSSGAMRTLIFAGALTLTHNATSLILPGAANIITAAGDVATFRSKGGGNWVCVGYQRGTGGPTVNVLSSPAITGNVVVTSTDASAIAGPTISLDRGSASAAAADDIGEVLFVGKDSAGNSQTYGRIFGRIEDPANGAEDGQMRFQTVVAGVEATRAAIGGGLAMIGAAGGDPGAGKINAMDLLINGVSVQESKIIAKGTTVAAQSSIDANVAAAIAAGYTAFELELDSISTAAAANIGLQFSNNGGSSFVTSGYRRADTLGYPTSGNQGGGSTSAPYIHLGGVTAVGNNKSAIRHMLYFGASAVTSVGNAWVDTGLPASTQNAGDLAIASANALRVMLSTGTFNAGTRWSVRGHKRT